MSNIVSFNSARRRRFSSKSSGEDDQPSANQRMAERLEKYKELHGPTLSRWKLKKRDPDDRTTLIQLARNLSAILDCLPHGRRGPALEAAKGPGSAKAGDANKYYSRVAIRDKGRGLAAPDILAKPLTPFVGKYVAVAKRAGELMDADASQGDPTMFLARLFRDTPYAPRAVAVGDVPEWANVLVRMLEQATNAISRRYRLPELMDQMHEADIYASDNGPEATFHVTDWLSETFHNYAPVADDSPEPEYLSERTEVDTPFSDLPLFVPRVQLFSEKHTITMTEARFTKSFHWAPCESEPVPPSEQHLLNPSLALTAETWLAIVPSKETSEATKVMRPALLVRPKIMLLTGSDALRVSLLKCSASGIELDLDAGKEGYQSWVSEDNILDQLSAVPNGFIRWFDQPSYFENGQYTEKGYLVRRIPGECDLDDFPWWAIPLNGVTARDYFDQLYGDLFPVTLSYDCQGLHRITDQLDAFVEAHSQHRLSGLVDIMAPHETVAWPIQVSLLVEREQCEIIRALEKDAARIRFQFERLHDGVRGVLDEAVAGFMDSFSRDEN